MNILISGGTGLIGRALSQACIQAGNSVTIISRNPSNLSYARSIRSIAWSDLNSFDEPIEVIINLAGENLGSGRWTSEKKKKILQSRLLAGEQLAQFALNRTIKPEVFLQASAIGYYGTSTDHTFSESSPPGSDFLAEIAQAWEASSQSVEAAGIRRVILRTSVVLDPKEGALARMVLPFRFFVGGALGNGKQWLSWIHLMDEVNAIRFAMNNQEIQGALNLCAPQPVTNEEFGRTLAKVIRKPYWLPVPAFALKGLLGEMSTMVLDGQKVLPTELIKRGFTFKFPDLKDALTDLLKQ